MRYRHPEFQQFLDAQTRSLEKQAVPEVFIISSVLASSRSGSLEIDGQAFNNYRNRIVDGYVATGAKERFAKQIFAHAVQETPTELLQNARHWNEIQAQLAQTALQPSRA